MTAGRQAGRAAACAWLLGVLVVPRSAAQEPGGGRMLDDFEDAARWSVIPSDGVALTARAGRGRTGRALRLDFDFQGHGGYAVVHRALPIDLPDDFVLTFWIRGDAPVNNLEVKLIDPSLENVWWRNQPNFVFQGGWRQVTIRRRHLEFAWGPRRGGDLRQAAAIEFAITAGTGGKGTVWLDDLRLEPRERGPVPDPAPVVSASGSLAAHPPYLAQDGDTTTAWRAPDTGEEWLALDFRRPREFSGLTILWEERRHSTRYQVELSDDGRRWTPVYSVQDGTGGADHVHLPESESRYLRLRFGRSAGNGQGYGVRALTVHPAAWAPGLNAFFHHVAEGAPRGRYPRYLLDEQSYWTMVGVNGDGHRGLLGQDGGFEPFAGEFSIEPFLMDGGKLWTWGDVRAAQSLEDGFLPVPSVEWAGHEVVLRVTAAAIGGPGRSSGLVRYRVSNRGATPRTVTLALAIRPFQVNPSWQFLGVPGGVARIDSITGDPTQVRVNHRVVRSLQPATRFGAVNYDGGDVTEYLSVGRIPSPRRVVDRFGHASGVLTYELDLAGGQSRDVFLLVPWSGRAPDLTPETAGQALAQAAEGWRGLLDRVRVTLPDSARAISNSLRTTLAHMLINRDGPALQPGARSYRRSWIRDGAMISAVLLRLGHPEPVREFMEWYAPYQQESGKVPCCVDARGADPVPEHDSHGELVYLLAEHYRFTGDSAELARLWPHVARAVGYIDSLRRSLRTDAHRQGDSLRYFGLMPPSISHEGYAARPVHSYWDGIFTLRGLTDAAAMARVLGQPDSARYRASRDEFRRDLLASIRTTISQARIGHLPGSADLADYDPTSSSIAVSPGGMLDALPRDIVESTFDRYFREAMAREDSTGWDAYTPYELRNVSTLVRLGWREKAYRLLRSLLAGQRPRAWNQWPEVVWRDGAAPRFLGDLPHTWVGSDFARSLLEMFAYVRDADSTLVLGAGIPLEWMTDTAGVRVENLPIGRGTVTLDIRRRWDLVTVRVEAGGLMPSGGVVLRLPEALLRRQLLPGAGTDVRREPGGEIRFTRLPGVVSFRE